MIIHNFTVKYLNIVLLPKLIILVNNTKPHKSLVLFWVTIYCFEATQTPSHAIISLCCKESDTGLDQHDNEVTMT